MGLFYPKFISLGFHSKIKFKNYVYRPDNVVCSTFILKKKKK